MNWDHYEFKIAEHYLSALINDDDSGMTANECIDFESWRDERENVA